MSKKADVQYNASAKHASTSTAADPILIHYKSGKHSFEVATHHEAGLIDQYRSSTGTSLLSKVLENNQVYTSFQKGQVASTDELRAVFDVKSNDEIIDTIIRQGVVQQSAGEKRVAAAHHRDAIVAHIVENYVNRTTRLPVDLADLNKAIEESKVHIPDHGDIAAAAATAVHALLGKMTLKEGHITGSVELKSELVGPVMGIILKYTQVKQESQYMFGDEMKYRVAIKPGDYHQFRSALDKATKGAYQFELGQIELQAEDDAAAAAAGAAAGGSKDHKAEERANAKTAQLADAVIKTEQKHHKHADEARARKAGGGGEE